MKSGGWKSRFLVFAGAFVFFICFLGIRSGHSLFLQYRAESFPAVQGKILSGEVVTTYGSKGGAHYHPSFLYSYQVAGQKFTGSRYRYDGHPSYSDLTPPTRIVEAHPVGSEIQVYYNPADPSDALLSPGVEGYDVSLLLIVFPVCLMMAYGMIKTGQEVLFAAAIAGGVKIISERMTIRVRLPQYDPLKWSFLTIGILSFISAIVADTNGGLKVAETMVLFAVLAGAIVYLWLWKRIYSGSQDLVIDDASRTVRLPLTYKRCERMECRFSDIAGVSLEKVAHSGKYGTTYTYAPTLQIAGKQPQRLTDLSKTRAESFAAWLREKIGLRLETEVKVTPK